MYIKTKLIHVLSYINLFEPIGEMLVLIAHAQRPPLNTHADVSIGLEILNPFTTPGRRAILNTKA